MEHTGEGLCAYAERKIGTPYFFGAKLQPLTESFMEVMHRMHGAIVTEAYMEKARKKQMIGKICCDCSGLIEGYTGIPLGTAQLYARASLRMPIEQVSLFPPGTILWKKGHVAVFTGYEHGSPCCIESRSIDYGCVKSEIKGRGFTHGLLLKDILYPVYDLPGQTPAKNPYPFPVQTLYPGNQGAHIKWLQYALVESGYELSVNGMFDRATTQALIAYQNTADLYLELGTAGPATICSLSEQSGSPVADPVRTR